MDGLVVVNGWVVLRMKNSDKVGFKEWVVVELVVLFSSLKVIF